MTSRSAKKPPVVVKTRFWHRQRIIEYSVLVGIIWLLAAISGRGPSTFLEAQTRAKTSRDLSTMRDLERRIIAEAKADGKLPEGVAIGIEGPALPAPKSPWGAEPLRTFVSKDPAEASLIPALDAHEQFPIAYWPAGEWIVLAAPGPDRVYNLAEGTLPPATPLDDPRPFLRVLYAYDPTNGTQSTGDILRIEKWRR